MAQSVGYWLQDVNEYSADNFNHSRTTSIAACALGGAMETGKGTVGTEGSSEDLITGAMPAGGSLRGEVDSGADLSCNDYDGCSPICCIRKYSEVCAVRCFRQTLERLPHLVHQVRGSQLHSRGEDSVGILNQSVNHYLQAVMHCGQTAGPSRGD